MYSPPLFEYFFSLSCLFLRFSKAWIRILFYYSSSFSSDVNLDTDTDIVFIIKLLMFFVQFLPSSSIKMNPVPESDVWVQIGICIRKKLLDPDLQKTKADPQPGSAFSLLSPTFFLSIRILIRIHIGHIRRGRFQPEVS